MTYFKLDECYLNLEASSVLSAVYNAMRNRIDVPFFTPETSTLEFDSSAYGEYNAIDTIDMLSDCIFCGAVEKPLELSSFAGTCYKFDARNQGLDTILLVI